MRLIPIEYSYYDVKNKTMKKLNYPKGINPTVFEVAGHFDIKYIHSMFKNKRFSLHTEYSAKARKFTSDIIKEKNEIKNSVHSNNYHQNIPLLWTNTKWAIEFADFIIELLNGKTPEIIEIHPPTILNNNGVTIDEFIKMYKLFKQKLLDNSIDCKISIENRNAFQNKKFLLSGMDDFVLFSKKIEQEGLDLQLILDIPQLLNYEIDKSLSDAKYIEKLDELFDKVKSIKHNISSFHLWGQVGSYSHQGDMLDYFQGSQTKKNEFYKKLWETFKNHENDIYFIPEINFEHNGKSQDKCLENIINDLISVGFRF